jgi:hypothetical protein
MFIFLIKSLKFCHSLYLFLSVREIQFHNDAEFRRPCYVIIIFNKVLDLEIYEPVNHKDLNPA